METIKNVSISELHSFRNHPFKVETNTELCELMRSIEKEVIVNGQNNALFIKKKFLLEFIEENELDVVWTVLGEKQKITDGFGRDFPGRAEFSYTYYINEKEEVSRNHKVYNIMEAGRY